MGDGDCEDCSEPVVIGAGREGSSNVGRFGGNVAACARMAGGESPLASPSGW